MTGARTAGPALAPAARTSARLPGLLAALLVAVVATVAGRFVPVVGAPVVAVVVGVLVSPVVRSHHALQPGIGFAGGRILQFAVVVLGSQLSLAQVVRVGSDSLPVMIGTLSVCLALAYVVGRAFGIGRDLRTLIGVGTGICGAAAIAAVSPVIRARSGDIAYAISTVFLFNVVAVVVFPPIGHLLGLSQHAFGLFAGTAVNDTSSVVAAASSYGTDAGHYAVVVKLTRTLMIIPICIGLAALTAHGAPAVAGTAGESAHRPIRPLRLVPWFLVGFLALAAANSIGLLPSSSHHALQTISVFLITTALAGIGMTTDLGGLRRAGPRPMLLGLVLWVAVSSTSLVLQWALG